MASLDKFKEAARKFEQKEQWAKALDAYVKAVEVFEESPEDDAELPLYGKAADLYLKVNDTSNAIAYYERAVDKYSDAGLVNQAIALCNKVMRLGPGRAGVYLRLGMLFAKKGFAAEAKQNLLEYAGRMQKAGQIEEAFKALKKFAEMTPGQDDIWKVLAEQARAQATTKEAKEQVDQLLSEFEAKDRQATQRKSRMSRSMITGEAIAEAPGPKKGELIFLDIDEVPKPGRKSGAVAAVAPPPPPPPPKAVEPEPPVEIPPLEIQQTSLVTEEPEPAAAEPPMLEVEPTAMAGSDLGIEPTSLGIEPTSLAVEPTARAFAEPPAEEPVAEEPVVEELVVEEAVVEEAVVEEAVAEEPIVVEPIGEAAVEPLLDIDLGEVGPTAPAPELPFLVEPEAVGAPELSLAMPDEAISIAMPDESTVAQSVEFLDLGEVTTTAPSVSDLEGRILANAEDWEAHQQLGELLLEQGERERGLAELEAALAGYDGVDNLEATYGLCEEILRLDPNSVRHHQKRVEVAYRQSDRPRLVDAYLELADALLRSDDPGKAVAVYQRVLEHDTDNVRARSAIETLSPPAAAAPAAAMPKPKAAPTKAPAPAAGDFVDLGSFLLDEEAPKDTRMRIEDEEPTGDEQKDFQQMLAAFKKGVEANVEETDFQSHYDLGVAFKEMGLLDEAIGEFQKALRAAEGRLKSSEALGLCFFEKGQFSVAETIMRRGLDAPANSEAERIGLLYWLGRALEEQQKVLEALEAYNRVFAVDINFSDVNKRVQALAKAAR